MKPENTLHFPASFESFGPDNGILKIALSGDWAAPWDERKSHTLDVALSFVLAVNTDPDAGKVTRIEFDGTALTAWDSRTLVAIISVSEQVEKDGVAISLWVNSTKPCNWHNSASARTTC